MLHHHSVSALSRALASKTISSLELTQLFLARIKQFDPQVNSFITVTEEHALEAAKRADQLRANGKAGPLTGIPIAQKDIFCTAGIKTSCGSKMLDHFIAPYNATLVEKCHQAGLVMLGKTNMDEFAMGSSNETSYYGPTKNPWHLDYVPGGSSGGSSAAVTAGFVPASTGTDTGGSIRQPAGFCNLTGLKPSYGRISRYGLIAFASSLDQGGPFAKTAEDVALLLNVMAGWDPRDPSTAPEHLHPVPDYTQTLNRSLKGMRLGLPKEYFSDDLNPSVMAIMQAAIQNYEKLGMVIQEISLPHATLSGSVYYVLAPAEASSNLARYDGVRFGYRCQNPVDLDDLYRRSRTEGFGTEVKRRIIIGTYVLSSGHYDDYYVKAQKIRRLIQRDFLSAFENVDLILSPTSPSAPFKLGEKISCPVHMYLSDMYTIAISLAGLPAISIPAGFINQLPFGMQLIGKPFDEATVLNVAHQYQCITDWHTRVPEIF